MLNKKAIAAMLLSGGLILSGCGLSNTAKGAGIGAGAGAIIGAGVGRVAGNTALGAIIGGVVACVAFIKVCQCQAGDGTAVAINQHAFVVDFGAGNICKKF